MDNGIHTYMCICMYVCIYASWYLSISTRKSQQCLTDGDAIPHKYQMPWNGMTICEDWPTNMHILIFDDVCEQLRNWLIKMSNAIKKE